MSLKNRTMQNMQSHPVRTGVFTILAVVMVGSLLGYAFGFSAPKGADAQIIVNGSVPPPPAPPPAPTPLPPTVVTPPPAPTPAKATTPAGNTSSSNSSSNTNDNGDTNNDNNTIVVTAATPDDGTAITVTGAAPTYTSPCCSLPSANSTPSTSKEIVVTGSAPTYTSPCCSIPAAPVAPPAILPVYTSPCCTVPVETPVIPFTPPIVPPIIVPPIVPPVVPPPVVPPPVVQPSSCTSLTSNKTIITSGEAVTLNWVTNNGTPVTVTDVTHGGTVTTSNNTTGTVVVNPTSETTYHASVPTDTNNASCTVTVKLAPPVVNNSSSCILLSADKSVINSGDAVTLTWKSNNASPVTVTNVTNGNSVVTTSSNLTGTVVVNPTVATTYHASVPGDEKNPNCTASVSLTPPGGGGGGGGGGGSGGGGGGYSPNVFFTSSRQAPPLGSVYLSQIPYTGLDLGPIGTALYWTMLVVWSLAAAYLVLFGGIPLLRRRFASFGASVGQALTTNEPAGLLPAHAGGAMIMPAASVAAARPNAGTAYAPAASVAAVHVQERAGSAYAAPAPAARTAPRLEMSGDGFKKFATNGSLTIDDIVKGLSRESGMEIAAEPQQSSTEAYAPVQEAPAPVAIERELPEAFAPAAPAYAAPRAERAPESVGADVIAFIGSILAGERDAVFSTIRRLNQAGHDAEEFVSHAILALDDAYKARIDGTPVHEDVKAVTDHCATSFLERLVTSLTTAVDGSYSMGVTGIKLALTRALAVAQG